MKKILGTIFSASLLALFLGGSFYLIQRSKSEAFTTFQHDSETMEVQALSRTLAPAGAESAALSVAETPLTIPEYYIIQEGDNLSIISEKFGLTVMELIRWNNIFRPNEIEIGDKLLLHEPAE